MIHHYITVYGEAGRVYAESWLQFNLFGLCFCFWKRKNEITPDDYTFLHSADNTGIHCGGKYRLPPVSDSRNGWEYVQA